MCFGKLLSCFSQDAWSNNFVRLWQETLQTWVLILQGPRDLFCIVKSQSVPSVFEWHSKCYKAWTNVDTFRYLLPQRRNRIWGFAAVAGARKREEMESTYTTVLNAMASHSKIASGEIFLPAPQQSLQKGRHEEVLANALKACGSRGLFVDCSTSVRRTVAMNCGVPCVLPTHPVWSVDHQRYLGASDFLRAQGIFPGSFKKEVYETMLNTNGLAQSIAGNSFSSTVFQAAALASMAATPAVWAGEACQRPQPPCHEPGASTTLRRVTGKRKRPEYDFALPLQKPSSKKKSSPKQRAQKKRRQYTRKEPGVDSRILSRGKKPMVSIAKKLEMLLGKIMDSMPHSQSIRTYR